MDKTERTDDMRDRETIEIRRPEVPEGYRLKLDEDGRAEFRFPINGEYCLAASGKVLTANMHFRPFGLILEPTQATPTIQDEIAAEMARAKELHPEWPFAVEGGVMIMAEESGEAVKAANEHRWFGGPLSDIRKELIHTIVTAMRCLENLEEEA